MIYDLEVDLDHDQELYQGEVLKLLTLSRRPMQGARIVDQTKLQRL